jgi:low temperature requirement protein LtrA
VTLGPRPLRSRSAGARVSNVELFFDLVYVFAVTQVSHALLSQLTPLGAAQSLILWFAVWLGWQYACWFSNWFDPDSLPVRLTIFATMFVALIMAAAIPQAFGDLGLVFALAYATLQVGRSAAAVVILGRDHSLGPNYRRILGWNLIAAAFWIGGALMPPAWRLVAWAAAVFFEYVSPMFGFWLPRLGRSKTTDWTIFGGHLAERCQLFVLVALGEGIVVTGTTINRAGLTNGPALVGLMVAFVGSVASWWLYFDTTSSAAAHAIEEAEDPGRMGAAFHYVHVALIGALVVMAVGSDLSIAHPDHHVEAAAAIVLLGGPALYLLANGVFKTIVYGRFPLSHMVGLVLLAGLSLPIFRTDQLMAAGLANSTLVLAAAWEWWSRRSAPPTDVPAAD